MWPGSPLPSRAWTALAEPQEASQTRAGKIAEVERDNLPGKSRQRRGGRQSRQDKGTEMRCGETSDNQDQEQRPERQAGDTANQARQDHFIASAAMSPNGHCPPGLWQGFAKPGRNGEIDGRPYQPGTADAAGTPMLGVVVIGRNEGDRLVDCLASLRHVEGPVVYVDSGSTDASEAVASCAGADVVALDPAVPFTAARARNAGWRRLLQTWPHLSYVQFLDGDCRIDPTWLPAAVECLRQRPDVAVVMGRRRERYPARSIYNAICDDEWDGPAGEVIECGGDVLLRAEVLRQLDGYRDDLIAGEEPELCVRLRQRGHRIWRLEREMSLHDANIVRFPQWWRRSVRAGHAYAQVHLIHQRAPERIWGANLRRTLSWSMLLPAAVIAGALLHPAWLSLAFLYPIQILRLRGRQKSFRRATLSVIGKFAEMQGVLQYLMHKVARRRQRLIEYK